MILHRFNIADDDTFYNSSVSLLTVEKNTKDTSI